MANSSRLLKFQGPCNVPVVTQSWLTGTPEFNICAFPSITSQSAFYVKDFWDELGHHLWARPYRPTLVPYLINAKSEQIPAVRCHSLVENHLRAAEAVTAAHYLAMVLEWDVQLSSENVMFGCQHTFVPSGVAMIWYCMEGISVYLCFLILLNKFL